MQLTINIPVLQLPVCLPLSS